MKLLIISDAWYPQVNGVVRTYEFLGAELEKRGHTVKVIGPSDFPVRIPMPGYAEIKLVVAPYRRLKRIIEDYAPDRIHISTEGPLGWAAHFYCLNHGRAFTTSYHTQFPDYVAKRLAKFTPFLYPAIHAISKRVVRAFHAPSSAMMVATESLENTLISWGFKNPMHRLSRGAKLDLFKPGPKTLFNDMPRPVALYVGRIAIEKNLEDFLAMEWDGSKVLVGDGPSLPFLQKKYPQAHFVGIKLGEDLAAHYRSADVFAFPSKTDTFGIVLVEAMASGLPIAGYNVTGPKDIVTQPYLGAVHETDLRIACMKALKQGSPERCAAHARENFTWEHAGQQFEDAQLNKSSVHKDYSEFGRKHRPRNGAAGA
jgi:glycosyltransferase involved in cell wall biosynthesis